MNVNNLKFSVYNSVYSLLILSIIHIFVDNFIKIVKNNKGIVISEYSAKYSRTGKVINCVLYSCSEVTVPFYNLIIL